MSGMDDPVMRAVRDAIYAAIVEKGAAPAAAEVARAHDLEARVVEEAYRALAAFHVIVLQPGTLDVWSAPPFSAVPTAFHVTVGRARHDAPCAWDAFGIPAALKRGAIIEGRCAWSGEPIPCGVERGLAYGDGVIHLLVAAAHFWDDIVYT